MAAACKGAQLQFLSFLARPHGACIALVIFALVVTSTVYTGSQLVATLSRGRSGCHTSDDNIAGVAFDEELCPEPIDIVYTWVNGSDPWFRAEMEAWRERMGLMHDDSGSGSGSGSSSSSSSSSSSGSSSGSGSGSGSGSDASDDPASSNRFRDNNELMYSLRSIEKYAPWVRRIHLLTNGQVPSWLDTEHPRVHVVAHSEVFVNASHLPVFSSPAIEAHLHRIPGLSNRFVYFNDDVFLGNPTWPDDFATRAGGQKVYLSWEVPKCNPGCIESWIGDGFCDQACNVTACDFDYPDCVNATVPGVGGSSTASSWEAPAYCASGCPNNWIGDKTCDKRCNVRECGFDGTDCGLGTLQAEVVGQAIHEAGEVLFVDSREEAFWIDVSALRESEETLVVAASHSKHQCLRTAVVSDYYSVAVVLFDTARHKTVADLNATALPAHAPTHDPFGRPVVESIRVWLTFDTPGQNRTEMTFDINVFVDGVTAQSGDGGEGAAPANGTSVVGTNSTSAGGVSGSGSGSGSGAGSRSARDWHLMEHQRAIEGMRGRGEELVRSLLGRGVGDGDAPAAGLGARGRHLLSLPATESPPARRPTRRPRRGAVEVEGRGGEARVAMRVARQRRSVYDVPQERASDTPAARRRLRAGTDERVVAATGDAAGSVGGGGGDARGSGDLLTRARRRALEALQLDAETGGEVRRAWRAALRAAAAAAGRGWHLGEGGVLHMPSAPVAGQQHHLRPATDGGDDEADATRRGGRRLLDTYADSLVFTNHLISRAFKRSPRKVPAHMPHMIDVRVMEKVQDRFADAFDATSTHRFRDSADIQFAFAYFYFIMEGGAQAGIDLDEYWASELDTDGDGVLSENELRTLAAVVAGEPPSQDLIDQLRNCLAPVEQRTERVETADGVVERTSTITPHMTLERLIACPQATDGLSQHARFPSTHEEMALDEVAFEMITDDYNKTLEQLDSIRARKSKFVCVNDDMREPSPELVQALEDFYLSFFPHPSQFELPAGTRNPYLYVEPLRAELARRRVVRQSLWAAGGVAGLAVAALAVSRASASRCVQCSPKAGVAAEASPAAHARAVGATAGGGEGSRGSRTTGDAEASPASGRRRSRRSRRGRSAGAEGQGKAKKT